MHFEPPRPRSDDERILPLINVVFLLLIFFMIVGKLSVVEPFELTPPESVSEKIPDNSPHVALAVAADGRLALNGEMIEEETLEREVRRLLKQDPKPRVLLKADGNAQAETVLIMMETVRAAGAEHMQLFTLPKSK